jgi:hypothetical protein
MRVRRTVEGVSCTTVAVAPTFAVELIRGSDSAKRLLGGFASVEGNRDGDGVPFAVSWKLRVPVIPKGSVRESRLEARTSARASRSTKSVAELRMALLSALAVAISGEELSTLRAAKGLVPLCATSTARASSSCSVLRSEERRFRWLCSSAGALGVLAADAPAAPGTLRAGSPAATAGIVLRSKG